MKLFLLYGIIFSSVIKRKKEGFLIHGKDVILQNRHLKTETIVPSPKEDHLKMVEEPCQKEESEEKIINKKHEDLQANKIYEPCFLIDGQSSSKINTTKTYPTKSRTCKESGQISNNASIRVSEDGKNKSVRSKNSFTYSVFDQCGDHKIPFSTKNKDITLPTLERKIRSLKEDSKRIEHYNGSIDNHMCCINPKLNTEIEYLAEECDFHFYVPQYKFYPFIEYSECYLTIFSLPSLPTKEFLW